MAAGAIPERFVIGHAEEHVAQLEGILAGAAAWAAHTAGGGRHARDEPDWTHQYRWAMAGAAFGPYVAVSGGNVAHPTWCPEGTR